MPRGLARDARYPQDHAIPRAGGDAHLDAGEVQFGATESLLQRKLRPHCAAGAYAKDAEPFVLLSSSSTSTLH